MGAIFIFFWFLKIQGREICNPTKKSRGLIEREKHKALSNMRLETTYDITEKIV